MGLKIHRWSLNWIGRNLRNVGKQSAKGYVVYQHGRIVLAEYGRVEAPGVGRVARPRWRGKTKWARPIFAKTAEAARLQAEHIVASKKAKGYKPVGRRILPPR